MSITEHRKRLLSFVAEGMLLRNEAFSPDVDIPSWLERREVFSQSVIDTVAAIDESDVPDVETMNVLDGRIGRGELWVPADSPFLTDPNAWLLLRWHDTQLCRISDIIKRHSERFGVLTEKTNTRARPAAKAADIKLWIQARINAGERANQVETEKVAREHFAPKVVGREVFRSLYQSMIPEDWSKTGPRSSGK